jgi:hypothetical protein
LKFVFQFGSLVWWWLAVVGVHEVVVLLWWLMLMISVLRFGSVWFFDL